MIDKSLPKSELVILLRQLLLCILGLVVVISLLWLGIRLSINHLQMQDPYVKAVMDLGGNSQRGQAIFIINCAGCHGADAQGLVGPNLRGVKDRKSQVQLIKQVVSGQTPPMPQFQPNPQEMSDLLAYLESL